eukprot:12775121-Alexandrium_andersonii.AAC.1
MRARVLARTPSHEQSSGALVHGRLCTLVRAREPVHETRHTAMVAQQLYCSVGALRKCSVLPVRFLSSSVRSIDS